MSLVAGTLDAVTALLNDVKAGAQMVPAADSSYLRSSAGFDAFSSFSRSFSVCSVPTRPRLSMPANAAPGAEDWAHSDADHTTFIYAAGDVD